MEKNKIKVYQGRLNKILGVTMVVDGIVGKNTRRHIHAYKQKKNIKPYNGVLDDVTMASIDKDYFFGTDWNKLVDNKFVVFVDAGHGGVNNDGSYMTAGKRARHDGYNLHDGANYYEGHENRIVAEMFIQECSKIGINCIRTYHPTKDTPLRERAEIVKDWASKGYYGYLHSFHSNAIAPTNTPQKLLNTRGFQVWTSRGQTMSDKIATIHYHNTIDQIGADNWVFMKQDYLDKDVDYEADFTILKLLENSGIPCILEEFGFHSSALDCEFITNPSIRGKRVKAAVNTATMTKEIIA